MSYTEGRSHFEKAKLDNPNKGILDLLDVLKHLSRDSWRWGLAHIPTTIERNRLPSHVAIHCQHHCHRSDVIRRAKTRDRNKIRVGVTAADRPCARVQQTADRNAEGRARGSCSK
jgi:hypothetical protein